MNDIHWFYREHPFLTFLLISMVVRALIGGYLAPSTGDVKNMIEEAIKKSKS